MALYENGQKAEEICVVCMVRRVLTSSEKLNVVEETQLNLVPTRLTFYLQARRPLRSKHCATMDQCVAKFDHYCPWLLNDVGAGNHGQFLWLVVVMAVIVVLHTWHIFHCTQGAEIFTYIIIQILHT